MSFTETVAAGRAFAKSDEPAPQANRELLATGAANIGGPFFGAMPGGGGTSQTAVNRLAGARTQVSELLTATMTLMTMLLLAPLIGMMPQATLAAVVIVYSLGLIKLKDFQEILTIRRTEFIWALVAFAGVMLLGHAEGHHCCHHCFSCSSCVQVADPPVYVLARRPGTNVFRPKSNEHPDDKAFPGLLMVRVEGRIFFANAEQIGHKLQKLVDESQARVVALHLRGVPDLEFTALKMLIVAEKRNRERGIRLWLVGANPAVLDMIRRSPLGEALGADAMHFNLEIAVDKYINDLRSERNVSE